MEDVIVSVILPLYNEERYVKTCIDSLAAQTYPLDKMEWILVDGNSTDKTVDIIKNYMTLGIYPIVLLDNEKKKTPYALNMGIQKARGKYIIRLDAHSYFYPDYIEKCVHYLDTTDADNVGGVAETEASNFVGKAIARMLSTKFGVGGAEFRLGSGNCYVDTVPFGAFRREVFESLGLFNPKLLRSEDNDMNSRIRENGGKIWLAEDIRVRYYCRESIGGILKMALQNGNALFFTIRENPKAMSLRHFIPFFFFLSLFALSVAICFIPFAKHFLAVELGLYMLINVFYSFIKKPAKYGVITIWLYPIFHIVYGAGSALSLLGISVY